jgi:hypothetical protein
VHRADADVVDSGRGVDLRRAVRREADDPVGADERSRLGDRRVALADVDAVGAGGDREVRAVVEDEQRSMLVARRAEPLGRAQDLVVARVLRAELHDVDAAAQGGVEPCRRARIGDQVQAGARETLHRATIERNGSPLVAERAAKQPPTVNT